MANQMRKTQDIDDIISHCGSISGETFVSRRSRRDCPSLRQHKIDLLAKNLREYHASAGAAALQYDDPKKADQCAAEPTIQRHHMNGSFHHFRFVVCMLGGTSVGLMLFLRYNVTIAILRMVNQTHIYLEQHPNRTVDDFLEEGYMLGGEFIWNNEIVAIILAWYMFSYTLPQTMTAKLSSVIGCRLSVPISLAICAVSTLLTPMAAYMGWKYVVACRLVNGVGASAVLPAMLALIENWMRFEEISLGLSVAQVLNASLTALTPLISGYLTEIHWKQAFYMPGFFTLGFCCLWLVMISDGPETNWLISKRELDYLYKCEQVVTQNCAVVSQRNSIKPGQDCCSGGGEECAGGHCNAGRPKDAPAPRGQPDDDSDLDSNKPDSWLQILKVPSFYAYIFVWIFYCSSYSGFVFVLPAYMRQFLKIRVSENGFYCFVIQLGCIVSVIWPHQVLRLLQKYLGFNMTQSRIACYLLCCSAVAATWIYVGTFHEWQLALLFLNRCMHGANDIIVTGTLMSNYAKAGMSSLAFAMVNTIGNFSITGVSTLIGWWLDKSGSSREGWQMIFTGLSVANMAAFVIYSTCIRSDPIRFRNKRKPAQQKERFDLEARDSLPPTSDDNARTKRSEDNFNKLKNQTTRND